MDEEGAPGVSRGDMAERFASAVLESVARVVGGNWEQGVDGTLEDMQDLLQNAALILDHRSSADELVQNFPQTALSTVAGLRVESPEVEPWKRVRIVCGGEDVHVHLGKKDAGSPFDRIFARIEDVTGGELVTYGLASYRESDSYAYLVLHERSWDAVRDALGDCFDEFFVGDFSE